MATLADIIESHLKQLMALAGDEIEIRRCDVAEQFDCVPSQINYVLETRFTPQRGYVVESRRGGGGYIRITRYVVRGRNTVESVLQEIGGKISMSRADEILMRMTDAGMIKRLTAGLIRAVLKDETRDLEPPFDQVVRAKLLRAMIRLTQRP